MRSADNLLLKEIVMFAEVEDGDSAVYTIGPGIKAVKDIVFVVALWYDNTANDGLRICDIIEGKLSASLGSMPG
jgi:hypothetical protein